MLNDEICKLREKLHESILKKNDYEVTYQISVELDQLIAEYYSTKVNLNEVKRKNNEVKRKNNEVKRKNNELKRKNKDKKIKM